jgi:hypothetical protein
VVAPGVIAASVWSASMVPAIAVNSSGLRSCVDGAPATGLDPPCNILRKFVEAMGQANNNSNNAAIIAAVRMTLRLFEGSFSLRSGLISPLMIEVFTSIFGAGLTCGSSACAKAA